MVFGCAAAVLGTITFSTGFKSPAFTSPADGFNKTCLFRWNGTHLVLVSVSPDVPN